MGEAFGVLFGRFGFERVIGGAVRRGASIRIIILKAFLQANRNAEATILRSFYSHISREGSRL